MSEAEAARFLADLKAAAGGVPDGLGLAVSGGSDSMAMLALAVAALPGRVWVASVDHRLREESAAEARMVAEVCARLHVPHATLVPSSPIDGANLSAAAREARYALLAEWASAAGVDCVATAHHADDQAETFLMRASRGAGLGGLAGVRTRVELAGAIAVRPLLDWRRAELRAIVRRAGLPFVDDPSNDDPARSRARVRALLQSNEWLDAPNLARAAAQVGEADRDMQAMVDWLWTERAEAEGAEVTLRIAALPREAKRRLARRAISTVRTAASIAVPDWSERQGIEPLLDALAAGRSATQAGVKAGAHGAVWRFVPAPPRRSHLRS